MELFNMIFNKAQIYNMLFLNIKAVTEYPDIAMLKGERPDLYESWMHICDKAEIENDVLARAEYYLKKAPYHPEFCKIIAITTGIARNDNGVLKRTLQMFSGNDELENVKKFREYLLRLQKESLEANVKYMHTLCGHNITGYDIPLLLKKLVLYRKEIELSEDSIIPKILKEYLCAKPWECNVVDTLNMWKFGGYEYSTLMLISDYLELKRKEDLITHDELSKYYWTNIGEKPEETINYITSQSLNQINFVFQVVNEMRRL